MWAPGDFLSNLLSNSYVREAPGTGAMRHGTEGWRSLETSFKAASFATHLFPFKSWDSAGHCCVCLGVSACSGPAKDKERVDTF